jgi:hypothetical protein
VSFTITGSLLSRIDGQTVFAKVSSFAVFRHRRDSPIRVGVRAKIMADRRSERDRQQDAHAGGAPVLRETKRAEGGNRIVIPC